MIIQVRSGIPELVRILCNSDSIGFPDFLAGIGLCSDGITFKHITMHEGQGRRVIPVRNFGIGINSRNSGIDRNSREFPVIPCRCDSRNSVPELDAGACSGVKESYDNHAIPELDGIRGIDATRNRMEL